VERNGESLSFAGTDPVAGWERWLEVVVAPTGEAARFKAATITATRVGDVPQR
jgi:hypothetical protein